MPKTERDIIEGHLKQHHAKYNNPSAGVMKALQHSNELGAGAKARKNLHGQEKVEVVMREFKRGTLHSGSGAIVKNRKQAIAIALSEAGLSNKSRRKK